MTQAPSGNAAMKNKILSIVSYSLKTVVLLCASGSLMQTFLSVMGFDPGLIYVHSSFLQAANVLTMLIASGYAKGAKSIKRAAISAIPLGILFLFYLPMAIMRSASTEAYIALVLVGIGQQIFLGLWNICDYKMPYYIYRAEEYGRILSICGIVGAVLTMLTSSFVFTLTLKYDYIVIMAVSFGICALLMLIVALLTAMIKNLYPDMEDEQTGTKGERISLVRLFSNPIFYKLIHANLLRGFSTGIVIVLATVALDLGFDETLTTSMVPIESAATLISCALFGAIATRIQPKYAVIAGSAVLCVLPLLLVNSRPVFLAVYAVVIFGKMLIDNSVPAMLIRVVPVEIAGPYHAWRIALQNAGTLIATSVAAFTPIPVMLVLGAAFQLIAGVSFFLIDRSARVK